MSRWKGRAPSLFDKASVMKKKIRDRPKWGRKSVVSAQHSNAMEGCSHNKNTAVKERGQFLTIGRTL